MARGGYRAGAGRPETENKRIPRGLKFSDEEWNTIKEIAKKQGMSARELLTSLVEKEYGHKQRETEAKK